MTDDGRLDLRSLDASDDPGRMERVVGAVMAEVASRPRGEDIRELRRYRAVLAAVAAVLTVVAIGATRMLPREPQPAVSDAVTGWAYDGHVPTNAELLAAYRGYRP